MGMSQEEIEALMSGTDLSLDEPSSDSDAQDEAESSVSNEDIDSLLADIDDQIAVEDSAEDQDIDLDNIDIPGVVIEDVDASESESSIDDSEIENMLADIDGVIDDTDSDITDLPEIESIEEQKNEIVEEDTSSSENLGSALDEQIEKGIYPLPVEKEHKVINQLSNVANDSEEKATQIFDVLSLILDENNEIQSNANEIESFIDKQIALLGSLKEKFPNVDLFSANLELAKEVKNKPITIKSKLDTENMKLFEAMELMQFHDINRQKIERVMSVIKKLSDYLNGLFEDTRENQDSPVAKHIHGDSSDTVTEDDLDALISEFGN
jgi:hypothetical protein